MELVGTLRHGEPGPGSVPRWKEKDSNQGCSSTRNEIRLAIASLLLAINFGVAVDLLRSTQKTITGCNLDPPILLEFSFEFDLAII